MLVLVPISLTPAVVRTLPAETGETVRMMHSGLSEAEREHTWHRLHRGLSRVLLGTRSSIFTLVADLGLVLVDEEHDPSFKQTDGFSGIRARDLAIVRGQRAGCPVVLGSATPSLESLRNAATGRYRHLRLDSRAGGALSPRMSTCWISATSLCSVACRSPARPGRWRCWQPAGRSSLLAEPARFRAGAELFQLRLAVGLPAL